jgi:hypothetical protein
MMRAVDVLYGLPFMFPVILLMVLFGRNLVDLFLALGAVQWLTMARIVRGQVLRLRAHDYVPAAQGIGRAGAVHPRPAPAAERRRTDHRRRHTDRPGGDVGGGLPEFSRGRTPGCVRSQSQPLLSGAGKLRASLGGVFAVELRFGGC